MPTSSDGSVLTSDLSGSEVPIPPIRAVAAGKKFFLA